MPAQDALEQDTAGTTKKTVDGETWTKPATIEDPKMLDGIGGALRGVGSNGTIGSAPTKLPGVHLICFIECLA
jgi:hypothetical protein